VPDSVTVSRGVFGKLPARGDFVRDGLPGSFVHPWDDWLQQRVAGSRARLGAGWLPAWLEAPVWRFRLAPGVCGPGGALGVLLPSVDSVGRYFPLTLAAVWPAAVAPPPAHTAGAWLEACESAGCDALAADIGPADLTARLPAPPGGGEPAEGAAGLWWTMGAPRVAAGRRLLAGLPDEDAFVAMLDETAAAGQA